MANTKNNRRRRGARRRITPFGAAVRLIVLLLVGVVVFCAVRAGMNTSKQILYPVAYEDLIEKYAGENDLESYFVMAVVKTESNFISDAHSGYATGLMQITDETAEWLAGKMKLETDSIDLYDPETNIKLGCYYLRFLIDRYDGNVDTALAAYNAGMGNVAEWLQNPEYSDDGENLKYIPFTETRNYVQRVNSSWEYYREYYAEYNRQQAELS